MRSHKYSSYTLGEHSYVRVQLKFDALKRKLKIIIILKRENQRAKGQMLERWGLSVHMPGN